MQKSQCIILQMTNFSNRKAYEERQELKVLLALFAVKPFDFSLPY
jgi:hypothetical protein